MIRFTLLLMIFLYWPGCFANTYTVQGQYTYMISPDGDILRVHNNTHEESRLHLGLNCVDIASTPTHVYVLNYQQCALYVISHTTFTIQETVSTIDAPLSIILSASHIFILHHARTLTPDSHSYLSIFDSQKLTFEKGFSIPSPLLYASISSTHLFLTGIRCNHLLILKLNTLECEADISFKQSVIKMVEQDSFLYILAYDEKKDKSKLIVIDTKTCTLVDSLEKYQYINELFCIKEMILACHTFGIDLIEASDYEQRLSLKADSLPNRVLTHKNLLLIFNDTANFLLYDFPSMTHLSTLELKDLPNYIEIDSDKMYVSHTHVAQITVIDLAQRKIIDEMPTQRARPIMTRTAQYLYIDGKRFVQFE